MLSTLPHTSSLNLSQIRLEIRAMQARLSQWRRQFHQYPELGFQEHLTADFISQRLTEMGIAHQTEVAQTGIVAIIESDFPGPVLAIRADIDALPVTEKNDVPYRSQHLGRMNA
jgi:amidohydrolase